MKKAIIITTTILSALTLSLPTQAAPTLDNSIDGKYYPLTGSVTEVVPNNLNTSEEVITFTCSNGNMFSFTAPNTDCWEVNDLVSCIMDNNSLPMNISLLCNNSI